MIKFDNYEVLGIEHAIRGMRNPMNSWEKSDSRYADQWEDGMIVGVDYLNYVIGPNDHELMMKLRNAGTDHRKFMRMLTVYVDITAPLYWWKEFDTYKVGTVANSCSTMHKIHSRDLTLDDFSHEHLFGIWLDSLEITIRTINVARKEYITAKDKRYWDQMIQLLPTSYNQLRTVMLNYEVLANIYKSRRNHRLEEWHEFCAWIEGLPYSEIITGGKGETNES